MSLPKTTDKKKLIKATLAEAGKSPHIQSRKQAIAVALETARRNAGSK